MKDAINFTVFLFGMLIALLWAWMKLFVWFCEWIFEPFVVWVWKGLQEKVGINRNLK